MDVVSSPVEDTELARLLTQLLRVVGPALAADNSGAAGLLTQLTGIQAVPEESAVPEGKAPAGSGVSAPAVSMPADAPAADEHATASALAAISASEARALIELVAARGIAQGELGGLLGLEKSTISRLAAGLEQKGWIRRGRDEENQRYVRLYLTPQGRAVAARVLAAWQSRQERLLAALTADERAGLETGLRGLIRTLAAQRASTDQPPSAGQAAPGPPGG